MNIYFSRPIAAGTELEPVYQKIADVLVLGGHTLTDPFVVYPTQWDFTLTPDEICERDYKAVAEADVLVWEASVHSSGCALEAAYAKSLGKPVIVLHWRLFGTRLSAMISGDKYFYKILYQTPESLSGILLGVLADKEKMLTPTSKLLEDVLDEVIRARQKHRKPIASIAEAYAVILEELDEFWDEVRAQHDKRSPENMRKELIQVAAMCLRTIEDCGL